MLDHNKKQSINLVLASEPDVPFIVLLTSKIMNSYLEQAYNSPFDWSKWEFELRDVIYKQNRNKIKDIERAYLIVQNEDKLGFVWVSEYSNEIFWIDTFILDFQFQGLGYGKIVFNLLLKGIKTHHPNFKYIDLGVQEKNTKAITFYSKLGFKPIEDISMSFYKTDRMRFEIYEN